MPEILQPAVYTPATLGIMDEPQYGSRLDQTQPLNVIDDATLLNYYFAESYSSSSTHVPSTLSSCAHDDFPTPKARLFNMSSQASPQCPVNYATCSEPSRRSRTDSDFDSLYDVTDDEAEVPLHASTSVRKQYASQLKRPRYPSIVIPSPSAWPTIEKLKSTASGVSMTPSHLLTPSRRCLNIIDSHNLHVPAHSAAPSLDGSLTSEEMDKLSCPATPDSHRRRGSVSSDSSWAPVQLDFQAMETLQHLGNSPSVEENSQTFQVNSRGGEMQEVPRPNLGLTIPRHASRQGSGDSTPVSALSVPSPGGFFSSLQSTARHTWSVPKQEDSVPNTSTAENFYGVPWETRCFSIPVRPATLPQRASTLGGSTLDGYEEPLMTARPDVLSPVQEGVEIKEINPSKTIFQYNENYNAELEKISSVNLEMTGRWLEEQDELQTALRDMSVLAATSPSSESRSRANSVDKPVVKKTVKFAEEAPQSAQDESVPEPIMTYVNGLEYIRSRTHARDTFIHRQTRAEAMHVQRRCNPAVHRDQLCGKFELNTPERPAPPRPVSEFFVNDPTALKERIARAQMERQALDQMLPVQWVLQAQKQLNGGKLLGKQAVRCITRTSTPRILDVGGVATNDWAWNVAYDYPYAQVVTVYTAGSNMSTQVAGPDNHKHMTVPNLWTLPFPNAHFDVISARTLYELLKTSKPLNRSADEYDLCIKEIYRCLKPGGVFEYKLLDADMIQAGRNAQAMGVEFGFNLKTRGYDAQSTKSFIPRLHKAGFKDVQRAWILLPMGKTAANWREELNVGAKTLQQEKTISADGEVAVEEEPVFGSTIEAAMLTGIVGSWAWEKWLLKLQMEMGKDEEKHLEGVVQMLEESAENNAAWRTLTGYARK